MKIRDLLFEGRIDPSLLNQFLKHCSEELGLESLPKINLIDNKEYSVTHKSFGGYSPDEKSIILATEGRHPVDVFRTLAHELTHYKQDLDGQLEGDDVGATGSPQENEANSVAGIIMRNFGQKFPEVFE
jgi:Zn-dependent peptidase ImmA (M78 family)